MTPYKPVNIQLREYLANKKVEKMKYLFLCLFLSACATPATTLTNSETGQTVTCGGSRTGSMAGGLIGYEIQKSNDKDCIKQHKQLGYEENTNAEN